MLLFYDWCASVSSLRACVALSDCVGAATGVFECLSGTRALWLVCWSKTEAPGSCLCDGFWQAGVHWFIIPLFFFSHTCLCLSGGMEEVVTEGTAVSALGSLIVFLLEKCDQLQSNKGRQLNRQHRRSVLSYSSWTVCAFLFKVIVHSY